MAGTDVGIRTRWKVVAAAEERPQMVVAVEEVAVELLHVVVVEEDAVEEVVAVVVEAEDAEAEVECVTTR